MVFRNPYFLILVLGVLDYQTVEYFLTILRMYQTLQFIEPKSCSVLKLCIKFLLTILSTRS